MICCVFKPMKNYFIYCLLAIFGLTSCTGNNAPDVSHIEINLELNRFEQDFFAIDTNNIQTSFENLSQKYPSFFQDFIINILGLPIKEFDQATAEMVIKRFLNDYRAIKDSADKLFGPTPDFYEEVKKGLKYVKYYFPEYPLPEKIISFVGPLDAIYAASTGSYGDVLTEEALAIGLQLHLGSNFSVYHSDFGLAMYPTYISRRFTPEYIAVNSMKNIIDDIFPDRSANLPLIEQMVEKGKRMYVLDKLLPNTPDSLLIGYTEAQLKGCIANEGLIWNYFVVNGLLYNREEPIIKNYIGDSPNTQELGEGAPGFIGLFVGWQIVKEYMKNQEAPSLVKLMQTPPREVFEASKYRPR